MSCSRAISMTSLEKRYWSTASPASSTSSTVPPSSSRARLIATALQCTSDMIPSNIPVESTGAGHRYFWRSASREGAGPRLEGDTQRIQHKRNQVVVANQGCGLDELLLVVALRQGAPGLVADGLLGVQFIRSPAQHGFKGIPSVRRRTKPDARH